MNSDQAISACNGMINGSLTFVPGVNDTAANFDGTADIEYTDSIFNSTSGSISLWFRKNSTDTFGGIMEIGQIGTSNSIGVFYNYTNYIYLEMRGSSSFEQAYTGDVIDQNAFTHIVALWDEREGTYYMKLFINGRYVSGNTLPGPFSHTQGYMKVGITDYYGRAKGVIDELRFFNWALSDSEVYEEYVYSSNKFRYKPTGKPVSTGPVKVIGKTLTVKNSPFKVKGIGYQPIPVGMSPSISTLDYVFTNQDIIARDVSYLKEMNVNTIRLWGQLSYDTVLLDAIEDAGIYAIMAFEVPSSTDDSDINYSNPDTIALYTTEITEYVNYFKNHPAVLAWAIGNENNLHYNGNMAGWYKLANELAKSAYKAEEPNYHPTMVINGYALYFGDVNYCSDDNSMNYVDIWGHNTYNRYDYHSYFCYYDKISAKPLIVTEFGVDAWDNNSSRENQAVQAQCDVNEWEQIKSNSLGGTLMEYSDEWWKCDSPSYHGLYGYYTDAQPDNFSNEAWYGVMAVQNNGTGPDIMIPREAYYALQQAFSYDTNSLRITISPQGAIDTGAQWRRTATTTWYDNNDTEKDILVGSYTVEFKDVAGWNTPASQNVTISAGHMTSATGTYTRQPGSLQVTKCSVAAGRKVNSDKISFSGTMDATADDFTDTNVVVTIDSNDMASPCIITFPINNKTWKVTKGKYSYSGTESKIKKSFTYNLKTGKFSFAASKLDLCGMACPLTVQIEINSYVGTAEVNEDVANGPRKPIPAKLTDCL